MMTQLQSDGTHWSIKGPLTFTTVMSIDAAAARLERLSSVTIDLSAVEQTDSAGLAMLIEWQRVAQKAGHTLSLINVPKQLQDMMALSGVNELFE